MDDEGDEQDGGVRALSLDETSEAPRSAFMRDLWMLLISAQANETGIPTEFIERKKEELRAKQEEQAKLEAEEQAQQESKEVVEDNDTEDALADLKADLRQRIRQFAPNHRETFEAFETWRSPWSQTVAHMLEGICR